MNSRIKTLVFSAALSMLFLFAGNVVAQDVAPRCEAAIDRAAGHYSKCLLLADAHYARHGNATKLGKRQDRCQNRFDRRTDRAFRLYGDDECASAELVAAVADRTVSYAEGVAIEAGGEPAPSLLFVQSADGGTLTDSALFLVGVNSQTGWFTDRPYRKAGQMTTEDFVALFSEDGPGSFGADPPNAAVTCTVDGEVVDYFVELTDPIFDGYDLSYTVDAVGAESLPVEAECEDAAHVFVDSACVDRSGTWATGNNPCETEEPATPYATFNKLQSFGTPLLALIFSIGNDG